MVTVKLMLLLLAAGFVGFACDASTPDREPTATGTPGATATASPPPSPTATPTSADLVHLEGVFETGFEHSAFYPETRCPGDGARYWVMWTPESRFGERIVEETGREPFAEPHTVAFRVAVRAERSPPGSYGHLGAYQREVTVHELLAAEVADDCFAAHDDGTGEQPGAIAPGEETTMRVGDEVAIVDASATLTFAGVLTDSRCPADVSCVWAGEALLAFLLDESGAAQAISVPFGSDAAAAVLGGFRVSVIELLPGTSSASAIAPDAYAATIVIEPLAPPEGISGVQGVVTLGPLCPVQRADRPCPDRPFEATLLLLDLSGREVARTNSGSDGLYRMAAPGGSYTLVPQPVEGRPLPAASAVPIAIRVGHWATVNVAYDSGIR